VHQTHLYKKTARGINGLINLAYAGEMKSRITGTRRLLRQNRTRRKGILLPACGAVGKQEKGALSLNENLLKVKHGADQRKKKQVSTRKGENQGINLKFIGNKVEQRSNLSIMGPISRL